MAHHSSSGGSSGSSSPLPSSAEMQKAISATLASTDRFMGHLSRVLATSSGTDSMLQTLQYTLVVLHTQLSRLRAWRLRKLLLAVARKTSAVLLPGETAVAMLDPPATSLDDVIGGSKALASLISDFRVFTRLWGLQDVYKWARSTWLSPPEDRLVRTIVWTQVVAGFGFQWYENLAYLADKGVLRGERFNKINQARWWEWSSRFWMAHVVLETVRLLRVRQLTSATTDTMNNKSGIENKAQRAEATAKWKRAMLVNAAWAPMTVHYSWEQGCLTEPWLGILGIVASGVGFRQLWNSTS